MKKSRSFLLAAAAAVLLSAVLVIAQSPAATTAGDAKAACCKDGKGCCGDKSCAPKKEAASPTEAKPAFVNTKCPIQGNPIDPSKVTAELTREFKGQKVAFCCGGCPPVWDKLSDAEKQTKLDAAK